MPSGITGATLIDFTGGTTILSAEVDANFLALKNNGVNNDSGTITTSGSGQVGLKSIASSSVQTGVVRMDVNANDTKIRGGSANTTDKITFDTGGLGDVFKISKDGIEVKPGYVSAVASFVTPDPGIGWKKQDNTKLFQTKSNGNFCIAGVYQTTGGTSTISTGQSFDTFDYAEIYPVDRLYASGSIVCPGDHDALTLCRHNACHAAMIISLHPGSCLGGEQFEDGAKTDEGHFILPVALAGRVVVPCSTAVRRRDLVCSDGHGSVRRMERGEVGLALGFALNDGRDGEVGIFVRPLFMQ